MFRRAPVKIAVRNRCHRALRFTQRMSRRMNVQTSGLILRSEVFMSSGVNVVGQSLKDETVEPECTTETPFFRKIKGEQSSTGL